MKSTISVALACLALLPISSLTTAASSGDNFRYASKKTITLRSNGSKHAVKILDFGENIEGHPTFEVVSASGNTSIFEVSFAESLSALDRYMGDGPINLAAAMDSYRVKRHNISKPGVYENRLVQGAFRYQKLNLSSAGELKLRKVGARATVHTTPITQLPGYFECSDKDITRIWRTGARTAQLTEIPKDTIPDFWVVTEEGSLVEGLAPQSLPSAIGSTSYTVAVDVKPKTGAFTIGVLLDSLNIGLHTIIDLVGGTVTAVNDRDEEIAKVRIEASRSSNWISVALRVEGSQISLSIDHKAVASFIQTAYTYGSFGLGAPFSHEVMYRNLVVTDLSGNTIYSSSLTERSFLDDFLMGTNPLDSIVDGSRRDRIAYAGDLDISIGVNFASTYEIEFVEGSLDLLGSYQLGIGPFIPTAKIQQPPRQYKVPGDRTGLIGYSFNLVASMAQTYFVTGDQSIAKKWAPSVVSMLDWANSKLSNGLFTLDDPSLVGDWNYYDPPQTGASGKFNTLYTYALQQSLPMLEAAGIDTEVYKTRLKSLRTAIHARLWNPDLEAYSLSSEISDGFAQDTQAFAILAGVPQVNNVSSKALLASMEHQLLLRAGPLAFSNGTAKHGFAQKISPYASSYHLRAALEAGDGKSAMNLLSSLWAPMANPSNANFTNCMWETLNPDGTPGLGAGTSLCHGWGAGPTAELNKYILGVQPLSPGFDKWHVKPMTLGLTSAKGRQPTPRGVIDVAWSFDKDGLLRMEVDGPESGGEIYLPSPLAEASSRVNFKVNGKDVAIQEFPITVSGRTVIKQQKRGRRALEK